MENDGFKEGRGGRLVYYTGFSMLSIQFVKLRNSLRHFVHCTSFIFIIHLQHFKDICSETIP